MTFWRAFGWRSIPEEFAIELLGERPKGFKSRHFQVLKVPPSQQIRELAATLLIVSWEASVGLAMWRISVKVLLLCKTVSDPGFC